MFSSSQKEILKSLLFILIAGFFFFFTRFHMLANPPYIGYVEGTWHQDTGYSDVHQDYERYANFWRYGMTPYRKHLFEYPPGAILPIRLPLDFDQAGFGKYYPNYRKMVFGFEVVLFSVLLATILKRKSSYLDKYLSVGFYIVAGWLAKDFWFDGLDLIFFGTFSLALMLGYLTDLKNKFWQLLFWVLLWYSVSVKLMTAPLLVIIMLYRYKQIGFTSLINSAIGGFLVWIVPLVLYRSSLIVFILFHAGRSLKFGSFGSVLVELINDFTQTEQRINLAPDFSMAGPVSTVMLKIFTVLMIVSMLIYMYQALKFVYFKVKKTVHFNDQVLLKLVLVFLYVFFLTTKTFSSPFHIWYVPIITLITFENNEKRLIFYILSLWMIGLDIAGLVNPSHEPVFGPVSWWRIRDQFRFIPMLALLPLSISLLSVKSKSKKGKNQVKLP